MSQTPDLWGWQHAFSLVRSGHRAPTSKNRVPNKSASPTKIVSKRRENQPVTEPTHRKVKTALDETRLLILGAQILLGFHLNGAFQSGFANLGSISRAFYAGAFFGMAAAVGLLITPSMEHLIVERGRSTARILNLTTCFAGLALLPMGLSLGTDLSIVLTYRFGAGVGVTVGFVASALALVLWYGAAFILRRSDKGEPVMDEHTSIDVRVEHMLTEARRPGWKSESAAWPPDRIGVGHVGT